MSSGTPSTNEKLTVNSLSLHSVLSTVIFPGWEDVVCIFNATFKQTEWIKGRISKYVQPMLELLPEIFIPDSSTF